MTVAMPLAKLLRVDQQTRWRRGEAVKVETYLDRNPALRDDADGLVDLIYSEMLLREEAGETPLLSEYLTRFAAFAEQLRPLFEVHHALRPEPTCRTPPPTGGGLDAKGFHVNLTPAAWPVVPGYQILGILGEGGMGVVYRARHTNLNRVVALKTLRNGHQGGAAQRTRFRAEAQVVARLQHPNIVQVFEIGADDELPYFAMEYVEGSTLTARIAGNPQPARDAARTVAVVSRAVDSAHRQGVVHRDLKPANVLLTVDGTPKVTDFGLAKILDDPSGPTQSGDVLGTPSYMAPEQVAGKVGAIGPAADIYALGAILYEMLTGRPPFKGETVTETLYQLMTADLVPPSRLRPQTPRDLEVICLKCLDRDPAKRYASARQLADDLQRFLDGKPIVARPLTAWGRAVKGARRHPAVTALVGVGAAAVVVVGLVVGWHEVGETRRLAVARDEVRVVIDKGREAFIGQDWQEARSQFDNALARMDTETSIADLRPEAARLRAEADRRLTDQAREQRVARTYREFVRLRDTALFHGMNSLADGSLFVGTDPTSHAQEAESAARQALALMGFSVDNDTAWNLDAAFREPAQRAAIEADCYTLLLVLADAVAERTTPDVDDAHRYHAALRILDRAAGLRQPTRVYHLRRGHYLEQLGDAEGAREEAYRAEGVLVRAALDYFLMGVHHARRHEIAEAVHAFESAVVQGDPFWAQCHLASLYLNQRQWEKAGAFLTACLHDRPDFVWAHLLRGYAHTQANAFEAAAADFEHAEKLLAVAPNEDARYALCVNRGMLELLEKKPDEAAADFRQAITLNPDHYGPYLNLARACREQKDPDEAERQLARGLRLNPPALVLADYHATRGRDFFLDKKYEEAVAACRVALTHRPDYAFTHGVMGNALLALKRYGEAATAYDRYLQSGGKPLLDVFRGRGQARMQLGNFLGARDDYTRVLEAEGAPDGGPGAEIFTHRGWAYFFADAWRPALRDFEDALRLDPEYGDAYTGRGLARVMLGTYREAVVDAEEALRRKPATPEMMHNVTCIFAQAVGKVEADPKEKGKAALTDRYRKAALATVRQTLALLGPEEQLPFWRDKVLPDTALDPIRQSPEFQQMVRENAGSAR